jgi:twitching motility protein PilT
MDEIISAAAQMRVSDVHLVKDLPIRFRLHGSLTDFGDHILTHEDCERYGYELAGEDMDRILTGGELDLARSIGGTRVRINLFRQQGHVSAAVRLLSDVIPKLENLGLPPAVVGLAELPRGIILVTGETGSGKSTTLAALLDRINHSRTEHILTLEDPVEYIYTADRCIVNQREIGRDTSSFADGLRAALREDPDVILIGEMRDTDTIETALTAAETGHLVFATLHTNSAADAIDRIVDVFPEARHRQIRMQLSMTLKAVVSQQLIATSDGKGRALACEVMIVTPAIRNLIREGKTPMIQNAISTTASEGAITMDNALLKLVRERKISNKAALDAAYDVDYIKKGLGLGR